MAGRDVDVSQLTKLTADLGHAPVRTLKGAGDVLVKAGKDVQAKAKTAAPKGETGRLSGSIGMEKLGPFKVEVFASRYYGMFQEYGTYKMPAHPFMGPSLDAAEPALVADVEKLLGGIL